MTWGELVIVALSVTTLGLWFFLLAAFACDEIRDADDLEERWAHNEQPPAVSPLARRRRGR